MKQSWPQPALSYGTCDENWMLRKSPFPPDRLQGDYWQSVPVDKQHYETPLDGQMITFINMLPEGGDAPLTQFTTELPALKFEFTTRFNHRCHNASTPPLGDLAILSTMSQLH